MPNYNSRREPITFTHPLSTSCWFIRSHLKTPFNAPLAILTQWSISAKLDLLCLTHHPRQDYYY